MTKFRLNISITLIVLCMGMSLPLSGCKGRRVRAELIVFAQTLEQTRAEADSVSQQFESIKMETAKQPAILQPQLKKMIQQIDKFTAPVKALNPQTSDVKALKDEYLRTWESLRAALDIINRVIETKDEKLAATMDEQLSSRMAAFDQSAKAFETGYKALSEKYGITGEDLGPAPLTVPAPTPFTPAPMPLPFTK